MRPHCGHAYCFALGFALRCSLIYYTRPNNYHTLKSPLLIIICYVHMFHNYCQNSVMNDIWMCAYTIICKWKVEHELLYFGGKDTFGNSRILIFAFHHHYNPCPCTITIKLGEVIFAKWLVSVWEIHEIYCLRNYPLYSICYNSFIVIILYNNYLQWSLDFQTCNKWQ